MAGLRLRWRVVSLRRQWARSMPIKSLAHPQDDPMPLADTVILLHLYHPQPQLITGPTLLLVRVGSTVCLPPERTREGMRTLETPLVNTAGPQYSSVVNNNNNNNNLVVLLHRVLPSLPSRLRSLHRQCGLRAPADRRAPYRQFHPLRGRRSQTPPVTSSVTLKIRKHTATKNNNLQFRTE